ncbi:hypothetical protein [Tardiphaga sp. 709]|jgi:hypothetical protein|uniref:hypothetical protein n=1 Tax=Tardiphaga sp. 709 TaxID=3076039 RepID=UPI0028F148BA|nr:hypothetical protein [Tardiphaga sp. 709]WNV09979.1 hypothetical protein RSO67_01920 [Tardiphaga sp. 709]
MKMSQVHADTEVFMSSREFEVEHAVENLCAISSDIAGYRLNNAARQILMSPSCRVRLALALDALQITHDDLEGKR